VKLNLIAAAACALAIFTAPLAQANSNPFYETYAVDITVTDVSVTYADGILQRHSDRAARSFVANGNFPDELRTEFEAGAAARGLTDDTYAERLSEFLVARSLRAKTSTLTGARRVRLEVEVIDARVSGMATGALFGGGSAFPRLSGAVRILNADTGALIASATITNAQSFSAHNEEAERVHGFRYNLSGTDTNFRLLAGSTESFSGHVDSVLTAATFADPDEDVVILHAPRITMRPPLITVTLATQ
jgi:hypothetical protein